MSQVTDNEKQRYFTNLAWRAAGNSEHSREDIVYGVLPEFLSLHKAPPYRFSIWPQMSLKWKPRHSNDQRQEITDFGLVNFTRHAVKLRCGVEVKRPIPLMAEMPRAADIKDLDEVKDSFYAVRLQAEDQAKASFKNNYCFNSSRPIHWILVVGPYWTPIQLGPFSPAALTVRSHKASSSEDFMARVKIEKLKLQTPPNLLELYRFDSGSSYNRLEEILRDTDNVATPLIDDILGRT